MSWLKGQGSKGDWLKAKSGEHFSGGYGYYDPKSQPFQTLANQKTVTPSTFFTKIGDKFLSLK